jgi:uncharacterized protein (DUF58 family)
MRRITTICPEGWYYLFVLLFIIGGAVLREVNLLVLLAGMMIGPFIFNWRLVKLTLRDIDFERQLPVRTFAGDPLVVTLTAHNHRTRLPSWALVFEDALRLEDAPGRENRMRVRRVLPYVGAGQSAGIEYRVLLTRRGRYRFGPLRISTRFPLGMVRSTVVYGRPQEMVVCPRLGRLTRNWLQVVDTRREGRQAARQRQGFLEGDYYGLREWRTGDSQRWIHWRTSAKLGELAVRQFEDQRNNDLAIVLDLWQPDSPTEAERVQTEIALSFLATAIADICRRGGSNMLVGVAGRDTHYWNGSASTLLAAEILECLAEVQPGEGHHIYEALEQVGEKRRTPGPMVVISTRGAPFLTTSGQLDPSADPLRPRPNYGNVTWIDCRTDQLSQYFSLDVEK